jgi:hypothetical protein
MGLEEPDSPIRITISSGFQLAEAAGRSPGRWRERAEGRGETFRQLRRANTIIEAVRLHQVVDDPTKLYKMIQEQEVAEGYSAKMDKKSLMRLLERLGREEQVRNIRVNFRHGQKSKQLHFVCNPDVSEDNTIIQSAIEQAKMKFNIPPRAAAVVKAETEFLTDSVTESVALMQQLEEPPQGSLPRPAARHGKPSSQRFGRRYGLQPKFVKMRELHLLLYYLIHGYTGQEGVDQAAARGRLAEQGLLAGAEEQELEGMRLYTEEVGWKMFVPPLPSHQGWPTAAGWCLMCDVLLRLPLSIFVKLVNITFELPGLQEYLTHPVRRNFLIRALPLHLRNKLLFQRKYIFAVHEVACRLAYIGALQFGPQKLKEKDQVFLFVNRSVSLLDTTGSEPGYHQVEPDREYPLEEFELNCLEAVERYWHRLWEVCHLTPLGGSSAVTGQEITLEVMEKKPAMLESLAPRAAEEALAADDGSVPGDGLGAAGLDSSVFAHLKRNWTWNTIAGSRRGDKLAPPFQPPEPDGRREVELRVGPGASVHRVTVTRQPNVRRTTKGQKRARAASGEAPAVGTRPAVIKRVVQRKQAAVERKPYYDEKDKAALRLMRKLRVDWSAREDSLLLLCKVAGSFLCAGSRNQMVQYTAVRDLLHSHFPESGNKTSRACQRRLNYMLRNPSSADDVALFLEDARQDPAVTGGFPVPSAGQLRRADNDHRLERDFGPLVEALVGKYRQAGAGAAPLQLPGTRAEVEEQYSLVFPASTGPARGQPFREPDTEEEVQAGVVNALITSSLCSVGDKKSWAYQLFKIYQQYPDSLLREVMARLRDNKMVSLKKHYNKARVKEGNYLPLSSAPYQLSVTFSHTFLCRYQYDLYSQAWATTRGLLAAPQEFTELVAGQEGGSAATAVELMATGALQFRTEVPEQLVVLDPTVAATDGNYVRILQRYRELLRNAGSMEGEDLEVMRRGGRPERPTTSALFRGDGGGPEEARGREGAGVEERVEQGPEDGMVVFKGGGDGDQRSTATVAKTASRIALYMMREEMKDSPADSLLGSNPVQHSHDFFVISSCAVLGQLRPPSGAPAESVAFHGLHVDPRLLPGDLAATRAVLASFALDVNGKSTRGTQQNYERRTVVPAVAVEWEVVRADCEAEGWAEEDMQALALLCTFVEGFGSVGASKAAVRGWRAPGEKRLRTEELLRLALRHFLLLRVGVVQQRYVAHRHCRAWLLHSFKVLRPNEELGSLKKAGKLYQGHGPRQDGRPSRRGSLERAEGGEDILCHHLRKNPQVGVRMSHDVADAVDRVDWGGVEEVLVTVRPWVRVDGTLNRRVLDRLLGAALGLAMQRPGQPVAALLARLAPALQPAHSRELLALLQELGCLHLARLTVAGGPVIGLFSRLGTVTLGVGSHSSDND